MTFTVQDDNGTVSGANSYITVAYFRAFHADRGTDVTTYTDTQVEEAAVRATDYVDQRWSFVGRKRNNNQDTEWPRTNAYDSSRYYVNGLPTVLLETTASYTHRALTTTLNPDPLLDENGLQIESKSEKLGPIAEATSYMKDGVFKMPVYPEADMRMRRSGLTENGGRMKRG